MVLAGIRYSSSEVIMKYPYFMRWRKDVWPISTSAQRVGLGTLSDEVLGGQVVVTFAAVPRLRRKHWWNHSWRWLWPRVVLECVEMNPLNQDLWKDGFFVYFRSNGVCMRTQWAVKDPLFFPRIGSQPVEFCAITTTGALLHLREVTAGKFGAAI